MRIIHGIIMKTKSHVHAHHVTERQDCPLAYRWCSPLCCIQLHATQVGNTEILKDITKKISLPWNYKGKTYISKWKKNFWKWKIMLWMLQHCELLCSAVEIRRSPGSSDLRRRRDLGLLVGEGGVPGSLGNPPAPQHSPPPFPPPPTTTTTNPILPLPSFPLHGIITLPIQHLTPLSIQF